MATRILPKTKLRERIRGELSELGDDTLVVTERGQPVAVAVSVERWNAIQELVDDLEDRLAVYEHRASGERGDPLDRVLDRIERDDGRAQRQARKTG